MNVLLTTGLLALLSASVFGQIKSRSYKAMIDALNAETVPYVSCAQLKTMPQAILLDTRQRPEYDVSHLPGARWVGYDEFDLTRVKDLPKTTPIVVYCSVGYRSEKVGEKLLSAGYKNVSNLYGSLFEWINQGNAVVGTDGKPTNRVHGYSRFWGVWLTRGEKVFD
ncbi:MAG: rhodanese-like domain-containing protein [Cytophagaceae bacterium]|nr:rhodanese-like domain-containing protein [Cytophagaceae bacterium]